MVYVEISYPKSIKHSGISKREFERELFLLLNRYNVEEQIILCYYLEKNVKIFVNVDNIDIVKMIYEKLSSGIVDCSEKNIDKVIFLDIIDETNWIERVLNVYKDLDEKKMEESLSILSRIRVCSIEMDRMLSTMRWQIFNQYQEKAVLPYDFNNALDEKCELGVKEVINSLDKMHGQTELKKYIEELEIMRKRLSKYSKLAEYPNEHLLFSIDKGNGCTSALEILYEYIKNGRMYCTRDMYAESIGFEETEFYYEPHAPVDMYQLVCDTISRFEEEKNTILAIHIEDWINLLDTKLFGMLMNFCNRERHNYIFVFIVPYLDDGTLSRVYRRLSETLNIRLIRFEPLPNEELLEVIKDNLNDLDFTVDCSAEDCIKHKLTLTRNSQHFYGFKSALKLTSELALMKANNILVKKINTPPDRFVAEDFIDLRTDEYINEATSGYENLDMMVGLQDVKQRIEEIVVSLKAQQKMKENGMKIETPCYHMMFTGNPGTGKTQVARLVGKIFRENGLLPIGDLIETNRFQMVGEYIGQTGPKTVEICRSAMGSILFIDEAYLLAAGGDRNNRDFGAEALGALIAEMENKRDKFVVILAGYKEDMENLYDLNPGLRNRIPHRIDFKNYTRKQLFEIFKLYIDKEYFANEDFFVCAENFFINLSREIVDAKEFGNARFVRNIVERVRIKALLRQQGNIALLDGKMCLVKVDFESAISDEDVNGKKDKKRMPSIGF